MINQYKSDAFALLHSIRRVVVFLCPVFICCVCSFCVNRMHLLVRVPHSMCSFALPVPGWMNVRVCVVCLCERVSIHVYSRLYINVAFFLDAWIMYYMLDGRVVVDIVFGFELCTCAHLVRN